MQLDIDFSLAGKTLVVTGAAGHICGSLVEYALNNGANCVSADSSERKLAEQYKKFGSASNQFATKQTDVTSDDSWAELLAFSKDRFGKLDCLVNGAGINAPGELFQAGISDFRSILDVNLVGTFIGTQTFGAEFVKQNAGSIINISSTSSDPPLSKAYAYSASKAGITNITKNSAREMAKYGVRVNAIRPGFFPTDWNKKNFLTQERISDILNHTPMARFGEPRELLSAFLFLMSDASSFVTGAEIIVDGGFSAQTI